METMYAFTDESGSHGFKFDKKDVSQYFIVSAVIVEESKIAAVEQEVENIRERYFQKGEMKSSSVGKNHGRRKVIIEQLQNIDFNVFAIVVDKKQIYKDSGLMYKETFYKFINQIVYKELRQAFRFLVVCADELGNNEYMQSFSKYMKKNSEYGDLFNQCEFSFSNSKKSILIQLADFISGTLSYCYEPSKMDNSNNYIDLLRGKIIRIENWPKRMISYTFNRENCPNNYDYRIADICLHQAQLFIEKNQEKMDENIQSQVIILKYLCFRLINNERRKYISTTELKKNLAYKIGRVLADQPFRQLIASMRDEHVIISSCNKGYKIPANIQELYDYINTQSTKIVPMVHRIKHCQDIIKLGTNGEVDLLDLKEYDELRKFCESSS